MSVGVHMCIYMCTHEYVYVCTCIVGSHVPVGDFLSGYVTY